MGLGTSDFYLNHGLRKKNSQEQKMHFYKKVTNKMKSHFLCDLDIMGQ